MQIDFTRLYLEIQSGVLISVCNVWVNTCLLFVAIENQSQVASVDPPVQVEDTISYLRLELSSVSVAITV